MLHYYTTQQIIDWVDIKYQFFERLWRKSLTFFKWKEEICLREVGILFHRTGQNFFRLFTRMCNLPKWVWRERLSDERVCMPWISDVLLNKEAIGVGRVITSLKKWKINFIVSKLWMLISDNRLVLSNNKSEDSLFSPKHNLNALFWRRYRFCK